MRWLFACLLLVLGFLAFRVFELEGRVATLGRAVEQLETQPPQIVAASESSRPRVIVIAPDGGVQDASLAALSRAGFAARAGTAERRSPAQLRELRRREDRRILEVVAQEKARVVDRHLAFHKERWLAPREAGLSEFAEHVGLSPVQRERVEELVRGEVDEMMELLRKPRYRDDPAAFVKQWDATLAATDRAVREILTKEQLPAWEEGRAFERAVFFPWLD